MLTLMLVNTRIRFAPSGYRSSLRAKREDANLPGEDLILMRAHGDSSASSVPDTLIKRPNKSPALLFQMIPLGDGLNGGTVGTDF